MSDDEPPEPFGEQFVEESRRHLLDEAKKSYELALNRLWAGNVTGLFAALGAFISGKDQRSLVFAALVAFALGVAALALGAFWSLIVQTRILRLYEDAEGLLNLPAGIATRPSVAAGLTWRDFQTLMATISGLCFFFGVLFGLCAAYQVHN